MSQVTDARTVWQQRDAREREQEAALLAAVKTHNAAARADKLTGEIVFRVRYKDGGVVSRRTEVCIDER